jgi:hypothetical protein
MVISPTAVKFIRQFSSTVISEGRRCLAQFISQDLVGLHGASVLGRTRIPFENFAKCVEHCRSPLLPNEDLQQFVAIGWPLQPLKQSSDLVYI